MNPLSLYGKLCRHMISNQTHKVLSVMQAPEYDKDGRPEIVTVSIPLLGNGTTFSWLGTPEDFQKEFTLSI